MIAAYVDGKPLPAAEVHARLASMRRGPAAAVLPDEATAEGRQLVRWLTQVAVIDRLLTDEAGVRGLPAGPPWPLDPTSKVQLGGALAAALASSPPATAAAYALTAHVLADPAPTAQQEIPRRRWVTSEGTGGPDNGGRPWELEIDCLPSDLAQAVASGAVGDMVGRYRLGEWSQPRPADGSPYDGLLAARNLALVRWVDVRIAEVVTLQPGFEHPGDIDQPDHTHRH